MAVPTDWLPFSCGQQSVRKPKKHSLPGLGAADPSLRASCKRAQSLTHAVGIDNQSSNQSVKLLIV